MGTMHPDFTGDVALVTGAAGGMGRAIAVAFATAGATVVAADVDVAGGEETERLVRAAGGSADFVVTDISDPDAVEALVATAVDRYGKLDCAVNAAAIENETSPLHECDLASFERMHAVNVRGVFLCMKYEIAAMLANDERPGGRGAIVNIASTNSFRPQHEPAGVHGVEARRPRAQPECGARLCGPGRSGQRDLPRLDRHADAPRRDAPTRAATRRTSPTGSACSAASARPTRSPPPPCGCAPTRRRSRWATRSPSTPATSPADRADQVRCSGQRVDGDGAEAAVDRDGRPVGNALGRVGDRGDARDAELAADDHGVRRDRADVGDDAFDDQEQRRPRRVGRRSDQDVAWFEHSTGR